MSEYILIASNFVPFIKTFLFWFCRIQEKWRVPFFSALHWFLSSTRLSYLHWKSQLQKLFHSTYFKIRNANFTLCAKQSFYHGHLEYLFEVTKLKLLALEFFILATFAIRSLSIRGFNYFQTKKIAHIAIGNNCGSCQEHNPRK